MAGENNWLRWSHIPYFMAGISGALVGPYIYDHAVGPWALETFGFGAVHEYSDEIKFGTGLAISVGLSVLVAIVHTAIQNRRSE